MNQYNRILTEIIKDKNTWSEIKEELSKYNIHDNITGEKDTRAGKIFELFTKYYFLTSPIEKDNFKKVWLFDETPLEVRNKLNLGNQDYGVDLILEDNEGELFVVQCKYKNDETCKLNWSADKIANLFAFCPNAYGYIVFSNAADLDSVSKSRHDKFTFFSIADLQELERDTIGNIYSLITENKFLTHNFFEPKPHQQKAIKECVDFFEIEPRGQLILPCGAGKTYTALWIKESLKCKNTLVLVPSLALLRQIKNEWTKQRKISYRYICVCSESDIDNDIPDTLVTHTYEVDIYVTTDSVKIREFLIKDYSEKVIFSTYHSLQSIADAIEETSFEFDFIFCDEAHKTAGIGMNKFSLVHDNSKIPSKRRLYATATPRIVKESIKKKLGDDLQYAYDMNDPKTFGYEFYRMTFKDAIEEGILVDYKIVAIGVNSKELKEYIENRRYIDSKISIDEIANNYALEQIMDRYEATHALTFHSRVKLATQFSDRHSELFSDVKTYWVSGEQTTSKRNNILNDFKNANRAVVSNSRCLTEGVDVPSIDLVYFCDPKNSKVDIVQAVGRALRKKEGKKIGLVVVPIYHTKKDTVEDSITDSSFRNLIQVIRSISDQDERLQDEINYLAYGKGKRESNKIDITSIGFTEEQDIILLEGFEEKLKNSLFDQIVDKTSNNWDLWFLQLKEFIEQNNRYPSNQDNLELYQWIGAQRNRKKNGSLKNEEIRKLNEISFIWNYNEWKWNSMFQNYKKYAKNNNHAPNGDSELTKWIASQKNQIRTNKLSPEKAALFNSIVLKSAIDLKWEKSYEILLQFRIRNQNSWPQYNREKPDLEESKLSIFCQQMRTKYRENNLEEYWFDKMVAIDFNFEGHNDNWLYYYKKIQKLLNEKQSISISKIGSNAYSWITRNRKSLEEGSLTKHQIELLEQLNIDALFETWERTFEKVKAWTTEKGKLPTRITNKDFNSWLYSQRFRYKNNTLSEAQIAQIKSIGFDLVANGIEKDAERWLERFEQVKLFKINEGTWPKFLALGIEGELYNWCQAQRQAQAGTHSGGRRKLLHGWQVEKLDSIGFHWSAIERNTSFWEKNYFELEAFLSKEELSKLGAINKNLNHWIYEQQISYEKGNYPKTKLEKLKRIGIDLTERTEISGRDGFRRWSNRLREIAQFIAKNKRYPRASKEKLESNFYQSLARTKRAYINNKLSEKQLKLIKELDIKLE
ncbi:DEAD/DEAH box helicase [uncultured Mucilaginibacter sp.]|uniref:DEAD/DEAH box helicase n=1 Tax=uncultured Mucilaginibacter sp. TaxID=797541 RepID=UPI002614F6BB|nr:DEAD/DEAH box helicase [uncultured Mucilaginibacter sp.]